MTGPDTIQVKYPLIHIKHEEWLVLLTFEVKALPQSATILADMTVSIALSFKQSVDSRQIVNNPNALCKLT